SVAAQVNLTEDELTQKVSEAKSKSNEILAKEIEIPENLQFVSKILFGIKTDRQVNLQELIILISLFVVLVLLIKVAAEIFFSDWKSWVLAVIVALLASISGGVLLMTGFILDLSTLFGVLEELGVINLAIGLILLVVIFFALGKLLKSIKNKAREEKAGEIGRDISFAAEVGKTTREFSP
ncbi:hypothetical protein HY450_00450, partial [Candidatus Pacearchaeota archaeon]|nr:hypothetical protein [Candidatus Pacearchaeota archaeon]